MTPRLRLPSFRDDSSLLRHGALLVFANFLGALCNAAFHMVSGRLLDGPEYAALTAMLGVILAVGTPMTALQNTLAHFVALHLAAGRACCVRPFFARVLRPFLLLALLVAAGGLLLRGPLADCWQGVPPSLAALTAVVLGLTLLMYPLYGLLQGLQAFTALAWTPQAWGSTRFLVGWLLLALVAPTAFCALSAQGLGVVLVLLFGGLAARRHLAPPACPHPAAVPPGFLRYWLSSALVIGSFACLMNLDVTLAAHYFGTAASATFAKAATIARTAVFLPQPVALALFPKVASDGTVPADAPRLLRRALLFAGLLIAGAAAVCCLFPILPWTILYGAPDPSETAEAFASLRAMTLAFVPLAFTYLLLHYETAQRRFRASFALIPAAALYLLALALRHQTLLDIPHILLAASLLSLLPLALSSLLLPLRRAP